MTELGKYLKKIRIDNDIILMDMAKTLNITSPELCNIEQRRVELKASQFGILIKEYKLSTNDKRKLFNLATKPPKRRDKKVVHRLKINKKYYDEIYDEIKTFEVRKNDRDYRVDDKLALYIPDEPDVLELAVDVIYILDNEEYCKEGYIVMGIRR